MAIFNDIDELIASLERNLKETEAEDNQDDDAIAKNHPDEHGRSNNTYYDR